VTPAKFNPNPLGYTYERLLEIDADLVGALELSRGPAPKARIERARKKVRDLIKKLATTINGSGT